MGGKVLIEWSHALIKDIVRKRYLFSQELLRNTHAELANLFFNEFCNDESCDDEEEEDEPGKVYSLYLRNYNDLLNTTHLERTLSICSYKFK